MPNETQPPSHASHRDPRPDHVVLVLGGSAPSPTTRDHLAPFQMVICADSGVDHARSLDLSPDVVVGDLDSISESGREWAESIGARFEIADRNKDLTDTELALELVTTIGPRRLTIIWGGGDRIDHVLGVLAAVASPTLATIEHLQLWVASDLVMVSHAPRTIRLDLPDDTTVSLVPLGGSVDGVSTTGLRWNLLDESMRADRARGVSNVILGPATVSIQTGVLAVIVPAATLVERNRP
jgi:thiamine pyrophosphokinase